MVFNLNCIENINIYDSILETILPSGSYIITNNIFIKDEYTDYFIEGNIFNEINIKNKNYYFSTFYLENGENGLYLLNSRNSVNDDFVFNSVTQILQSSTTSTLVNKIYL
jgi:hypothetical protein